MKRYYGYVISFFHVVFLTACMFRHIDVPLGKGYYFIPDGQYSRITKSTTEKHEGISMEVIPSNVIHYEYDKTTIIAISSDFNTGDWSFWIIDKKIPVNMNECNDVESFNRVLHSNVDGPLNRDDFLNLLELKNISLRISY